MTITAASSLLLRRSMLFRTASSASCRSIIKSKRSSFLPCQPLPNSCHQFFSSSPDYHATHDTSSWQQNGAAHQPYFSNNNGASNDSSHAVIKNLAEQEFARLDNNSHHHHHQGVNYNNNNNNSPLEGPRTSVLMELTDRVGALHDVLKY